MYNDIRFEIKDSIEDLEIDELEYQRNYLITKYGYFNSLKNPVLLKISDVLTRKMAEERKHIYY